MPVTRETVEQVVVKYLLDVVEDLDPADVDPSQSMKDLGANSLDMVEVVSSSMRELRIRVPRSELSKLTNIRELVDLLYETASAKAA